MTLSQRAQDATREELARNLKLADMTTTGISKGIRLPDDRVAAALEVIEARPQDVWLVRDYLDRVIRSQGATPHPYSSLSENMRASAKGWFPLVDVDEAMKEAAR